MKEVTGLCLFVWSPSWRGSSPSRRGCETFIYVGRLGERLGREKEGSVNFFYSIFCFPSHLISYVWYGEGLHTWSGVSPDRRRRESHNPLSRNMLMDTVCNRYVARWCRVRCCNSAVPAQNRRYHHFVQKQEISSFCSEIQSKNKKPKEPFKDCCKYF